MSRTLFSILLLCCSLSVAAQSNGFDKKLDKARELAQRDKMDDAEKYLVSLMNKNPEHGDGWDLLAEILYQQYEKSTQSDQFLNGNITVTVKDSTGKETTSTDDSLADVLRNLFSEISPSKQAYAKFIYTLRKGSLLSHDAFMCSAYLRVLNIDPEIDSNINKKAIRYYKKGEEEFQNKNYAAAAMQYRHAIEEEPGFYKARLYLGDVYYSSGDYAAAVTSFKEAIAKFPDLLEPRKYLVDAYLKQRLYEKTIEEAINTFLVYPDYSMVMRLEEALFLNHQKLNITPLTRSVFPNVIKDTTKRNLSEYSDPDPLVAEGAWKYYVAAAGKMKPYCDTNGIIIRPNKLSSSKYLEVYSWEEMLKNSTDPSLETARDMQQKGFLDCYIFITCFHFDLYAQYHDFVTNNRDHVLQYFKTFIKSA